MIWILALILVVVIVLLYQREAKKRDEWQLEYRYLTRHAKEARALEPELQDQLNSVFSNATNPNVLSNTKATSSLNKASSASSEGEEMSIALVEPVEDLAPKWKKWQQQMHYRLRETRPMPFRKGQDLLAMVQEAMHKGPHAKKTPVNEVIPSSDNVATDWPSSHAVKPQPDEEIQILQAASVPNKVIDVPDLNDMVWHAAKAEEAKEGYALTPQDDDIWAERFADDENEAALPQEITLDEINIRRERLREYSSNTPHIVANVEEDLQVAEEVIREEDVAHVIRQIKDEGEPETIERETIALHEVEHVIAAIKGEPKNHLNDLEVIALSPKAALKTAKVQGDLEIIGLDEIQEQRQLKARVQNYALQQQVLQNQSLETIHLPENSYVPKGRSERIEAEVIEFPHAKIKQVSPKEAPSLQTIVMTEQGLQTVKAQNKGLTPTGRSGRAEADTALLNAMVSHSEQTMIADDDIRANLLRQRLARRRGENDFMTENSVQTDVIAEEEVLANLAKTDSPVNRQQRVSKPRPMVRESVIPSAVRIGEHGFKVKPSVVANGVNASATNVAAPSTPISTRFTPYAHPELQSQDVVSEIGASAYAVEQASDVHQMAVLQQAAQQAVLRPHVITPTSVPMELEVAPFEEAPQNCQVESNSWARAVAQPTKPTVPSKQVTATVVDVSTPMTLSEPIGQVAQAIDKTNRVVADKVSVPNTPTHTAMQTEPDAWLPSLALLNPSLDDSSLRPSEDVLLNNGIIIEEKLAEFKVNVAVTDAYAGPVITRYEIEPATGVRGSQVVNLEKDLARSLGFASIRVVETIPGKTCMGLELPNPKRQIIRLSSVLQSPAFQESKSKLTLVLGQDISGNPVVTDLAKAPHLLVAGTTGSGKSVGVNAMILSLLYKATPEEVRMIMIDPKMLELSVYEGIPHLLAPVVTDMRLAANALNWCVNEMEKRYRLMSHMGVRNVAGFNQKIAEAQAQGQRITNPFSITPDEPDLLDKLPFIVVVVDEFADLMMTAGKKIEELIARLAQKARAAGIHLVLATQRPSVDVITGLIKANIPTRIAFQVSSKIDSRTILDQMGAENLLGQGDMLFLPPGTGYPRRVHGAFVADDEVHNVVEYLKQFGEPDYVEDLLTHGMDDSVSADASSSRQAEEDPLYDQAVGFVTSSGKTSISAVQRQMRIGYNRAARLVEQMEAAGVLSAPEHNGNRTLLVPQKEY